MATLRGIVWVVSLVLALAPLAAFADSSKHAQDELENGRAQLALAQVTVNEMETQATLSADNERMIAELRSEAMRQRQLDLVANANAIEQIAAALANAARANGDLNARNELLIAQNKAAVLTAKIDANLANGQMLALTKGRADELLNAQAQADLLHRVANFISGQLAETNMSNAVIIGQEQADAIHTPAIAQQQNGLAMGAQELFAADLAVRGGVVAASSSRISAGEREAALLDHAESSLASDEARVGESR